MLLNKNIHRASKSACHININICFFFFYLYRLCTAKTIKELIHSRSNDCIIIMANQLRVSVYCR